MKIPKKAVAAAVVALLGGAGIYNSCRKPPVQDAPAARIEDQASRTTPRRNMPQAQPQVREQELAQTQKSAVSAPEAASTPAQQQSASAKPASDATSAPSAAASHAAPTTSPAPAKAPAALERAVLMPHKFYHVTNTGSQQYRISYNHSERIAATEGKLLFAQPSDIASRIYFSPGRADNDLLSKYLQRKGRDIILDLQEARKGMQGDRRKLTLLGNYATYTPAASGATQEYKQQDQRASATFRVELDLGDIASSAAPASSSAQVLPAQASPASSTQAPTAPAPITQARTFQAPTAYTPTPAKAQAPLPDLLQELPTATPRAAVISPYTLLAQIPSAPTKVSQAEVLAHPATNQAAPAANPENYAERNSTETRAAAQTKAVVETRATTDVATRLQNTPETQKANLEKSISELQRAPAVQPQYLPSARSIEMLAAITPALTYTTITPRAPAAAAAPTIATVAAAPIGSPASFKLVQKYFINAPAPNTMQPWSLKRLRYGEESLRESPFVFAEISERSPWTGNSYGAGNMFSTSQSAIYAWNPDAPMQLAQSRVQVMQRTTHGKILYRPTFRGYRILPQDWLQQQTPQRFRFQSVRETYGI